MASSSTLNLIMGSCVVFKAGKCKQVAHSGICSYDCLVPSMIETIIDDAFDRGFESGYRDGQKD